MTTIHEIRLSQYTDILITISGNGDSVEGESISYLDNVISGQVKLTLETSYSTTEYSEENSPFRDISKATAIKALYRALGARRAKRVLNTTLWCKQGCNDPKNKDTDLGYFGNCIY